jgi:hypothetical protein
LGIKQWVDGLALEHFKGLINSKFLLFLSYKKIMKIIVSGMLQKLLKYWTIRMRDHCSSKPVTQHIILEIYQALSHRGYCTKIGMISSLWPKPAKDQLHLFMFNPLVVTILFEVH